jgi:hypothetical protein
MIYSSFLTYLKYITRTVIAKIIVIANEPYPIIVSVVLQEVKCSLLKCSYSLFLSILFKKYSILPFSFWTSYNNFFNVVLDLPDIGLPFVLNALDGLIWLDFDDLVDDLADD